MRSFHNFKGAYTVAGDHLLQATGHRGHRHLFGVFTVPKFTNVFLDQPSHGEFKMHQTTVLTSKTICSNAPSQIYKRVFCSPHNCWFLVEPTPLKDMKVNWDDDMLNIWKTTCSKTSTRLGWTFGKSYIDLRAILDVAMEHWIMAQLEVTYMTEFYEEMLVFCGKS